MINEQDREALVEYRLTQASETIDLARFLISSEKLSVAVNRIYYGMYYSLTALALKYRFETSKHSQLIGWFNKEFIATEQVDIKYGRIIRNAYQNRTKGDYDAFVVFTREEVESMLIDMIEFIEEIKSLTK
ncbi:MAG: HEPN domain-containing protein [Bacteroidales bacterium]|nr:HEPN domain-containing protein [Bacteroidales bacterium]